MTDSGQFITNTVTRQAAATGGIEYIESGVLRLLDLRPVAANGQQQQYFRNPTVPVRNSKTAADLPDSCTI